jgi:uncharacterized protein (TIGR03437 family)
MLTVAPGFHFCLHFCEHKYMRWQILTVCVCFSLIGCAALAQQPTVTSVSAATLSPGSLATIFGSGLAAGLSSASSVPLSTALSDVTSVTINGIPAPLMFVSDGQISVQVPWEVVPGPATLIVNRASSSSQPMPLQVNAFAPALISLNLGTGQALATNADGTITAPTGPLPGFNSHPATAGDTVTFFATGLGTVNPPPLDGSNSSDVTRQTTSTPAVQIGGVTAQVSFSGLSPQFVGIYQLSVVVPGGVTTGNTVAVQVQTADGSNSNPVTIALQ